MLISTVYADGRSSQPLIMNRQLLQKIKHLTTSRQIEAVLGKADACVPVGKQSNEITICQWKGDPNSDSIINTLNVTFEIDQVVNICMITVEGKFICLN